MRSGRFLSTLAGVAILVLGAFSILYALLLWSAGAPSQDQTTLILLAVYGAGMVASAYGLLKGFKWGWILATLLVALNTASSLIYGNTLALIVNATILLLLLLVAKQYMTRPFKPTPPVPPPSAPLPHYVHHTVDNHRFVRRKE